MKEVYIVSAKRTPTGGFLSSLKEFSAPKLGAIAIEGVLNESKINPNNIDSVYMGNVLSANLGQSPARQASKFGGIPDHVDCTTINKVCAAGMKATILGAQQIQLGLENLVVTGGMESMSNTPHYTNLRKQTKLGHETYIDGLLKDGLTDVYHNYHMGTAAELCAEKFNITREEQDVYAIESYRKAEEAFKNSKFNNEIIPVNINVKSQQLTLDRDEDVFKLIPEKVGKLTSAFLNDGTITAANASNLNDGAAAILLASKNAVEKHNLKPIAKIIAYADASLAPEWFTLAPAEAIQKAIKRANLSLDEIDFFEINEAYAVVAMANQKMLAMPKHKINPYGGAVAIGHPLGASGARIICTLVSVLRQENGRYGVAAICNGGGGASAIVIENVS